MPSSSSLRTSLRRAVLLSLSVPASLQAAQGCGGTVVETPDGTGGATSSTSTSTSPGCAIVSTTPIYTLGTCESDFDLVGPASSCSPGAYGALDASQCAALCPPSSANLAAVMCWANTVDAGPAQLACAYYQPCGTGRRPPGLAPLDAEGDEGVVVARFLAEVAHLEAASVLAFEQLAGELEAHAAPERLVHAARRAALDEIQHARVMTRLAEGAGARPRPVGARPTPPRSLEAIALDNAVEGCVRETFGAVVAMHQAERAPSEALRRAMGRIADEEADHAALAWELDAWLGERLDEGARRRVLEARRRAAEDLGREVAREPPAALVAELGWPAACAARAALAALSHALWDERAA